MSDSDRSLPPRPSLEQQKKQAKDLFSAFRDGIATATRRIRRHLPDKPRITLADAQFTIAREYGFESWADLRGRVEAAGRRADPPAEAGSGATAGRAGRGGNGANLPPEVRAEFGRAFAARDAGTLRRLLERHAAARELIDAPLFPFDAPALVHAAGMEGAGVLELVEVLLEFGADPNRRSGWWAGGCHALHVARGPAADRLIAAGAVPDACAASNLDRPALLAELTDAHPARVHERGGDGRTPLHFARSRTVVDLLLERGADPDARDRDHRGTPAEWMLAGRRGAGRYELAAHLVEQGAAADVFLAAALGIVAPLRRMIDVDPALLALRTHQGAYGEQPPGSFHIYTWTIGQNLSPLQVAARFEQDEAYQVLRDAAEPAQRLVDACRRADADEAVRLLEAFPGLVDELTRDELRALPDAAWEGNADAVALMLSLGFDAAAPGQDSGTALHCAAWKGAADCVEAVLRHRDSRSLLERPDDRHGSTPLGWCCHGAANCANPSGDYVAVARLLVGAGARPHPDMEAPPEVMAVLREG